jgi:hypothetical protein
VYDSVNFSSSASLEVEVSDSWRGRGGAGEALAGSDMVWGVFGDERVVWELQWTFFIVSISLLYTF